MQTPRELLDNEPLDSKPLDNKPVLETELLVELGIKQRRFSLPFTT